MSRGKVNYSNLQFCFLLILLIQNFTTVFAQQSNENLLTKYQDEYKIKVSLGFQMWTTYTTNQEIFEPSISSYKQLENRWNTQLRRSRLNISGQAYGNLSFKLTGALDLIGRDANSATQGGNNNGNFGQLALWNMYMRWKPLSKSDLLHITSGFQPPQIGRESITSAFNSTSFEKSWSQNYLRRTIIGRGPGRSMGINIGGQKNFTSPFSVNYNIGFFTPQAFSKVSNSQGVNASPLLVARIVFSFGDPESKNYTTTYRINYFGKRRGLSMAVAGSHHGQTDIFDNNESIGFDFLFNYNQLNIDGEWTFFSRNKRIENRLVSTSSNAAYLRIGYNVILADQQFLEPVFMISKFNGPLFAAEQNNAVLLSAFAGSDQIVEIAINYHLNSELKITLAYTMNNGSLGEGPEGSSFNNYFVNSNKDAIRRGNLLGLSLLGIF